MNIKVKRYSNNQMINDLFYVHNMMEYLIVLSSEILGLKVYNVLFSVNSTAHLTIVSHLAGLLCSPVTFKIRQASFPGSLFSIFHHMQMKKILILLTCIWKPQVLEGELHFHVKTSHKNQDSSLVVSSLWVSWAWPNPSIFVEGSKPIHFLLWM